MEATMTPAETAGDARIVEGSNGMLLEVDGQILPNYDATLVPFEEGDVVTGKVVRIDQDEVLVDIGYKSEGVIPASELSIRKSVDPHEEVELGEEVDALVLTKEDQDGRLVLSKKRARFEKAWRKIERAAESGEPVEGTVIEVVKGGLIIDLDGIDGLIHISELSWSHVNHPSEILSIGDVVPVKVLDIDRERQRISLGLKQTQEDPWQRVVDTYRLGDELEGKVTKVVSFGAFVEILDGVEGLVHISELANPHVENPREVVNQGDVIRVKILEIDSDRRRLSLSAKRVEGQVLPLPGSTAVPGPGTHTEGEIGEVRDLGLSEDVFAGAIDESAPGDGTADEERVAVDEAVGADDPAAVSPPPEEPAAPEEQPPADPPP